jgi:hypothetical protein
MYYFCKEIKILRFYEWNRIENSQTNKKLYVAKIQYKKLAPYPQDKYPFKRFIFLKSCSNYYSYYTKYFPFNFYKRDCLRFYFLSIFFSFDKCFHFTKFNYMYIVHILKWQVSYNFCQNRFKYKTFDHSTWCQLFVLYFSNIQFFICLLGLICV